MTINRVPSVPFAQIANAALRDKRLSFKARGILALVLSNIGEWEASVEWIIAQSDHDGRAAVQSALKELTDLGYREVRKSHNAGQIRTVVDWFHEPKTRPTGNVTVTDGDRHAGGPSIEHYLPEHHLTEHHQEKPVAEATPSQRTNKLAKIYTDAVPLSNFVAVRGVVSKAVKAGMWSDEEIAAALTRMADDGRSVTTDALRYELTGFPTRQSNRTRALAAGAERTRKLAAGEQSLWEIGQ